MSMGRVLFKLFGVGKPRSLQGFGGFFSSFWPVVAVVLAIPDGWPRLQRPIGRRRPACPALAA